MPVAIIIHWEPSTWALRLFVPARAVRAFQSSYSGNSEVHLAAFALSRIRGKRLFSTPCFLFELSLSVGGVPCLSRSSLWEHPFRFCVDELSIAMGSDSLIRIGWTIRSKLAPPGVSIASSFEGEMAPFDESEAFVSPGYPYDHRRGRASVPLSLRGTSIPNEVEVYRQYARRYFDANRFSEVPADTTHSDKRNSSDAWLARSVHLSITPSSEPAKVGHCDRPFVRSHAQSRYPRSLKRMVSDLDSGLAHPAAPFAPPGQNILNYWDSSRRTTNYTAGAIASGGETAALMNPALENVLDICSFWHEQEYHDIATRVGGHWYLHATEFWYVWHRTPSLYPHSSRSRVP